jgi:hypothetical protein
VRFSELLKVCEACFGEPRRSGTSTLCSRRLGLGIRV